MSTGIDSLSNTTGLYDFTRFVQPPFEADWPSHAKGATSLDSAQQALFAMARVASYKLHSTAVNAGKMLWPYGSISDAEADAFAQTLILFFLLSLVGVATILGHGWLQKKRRSFLKKNKDADEHEVDRQVVAKKTRGAWGMFLLYILASLSIMLTSIFLSSDRGSMLWMGNRQGIAWSSAFLGTFAMGLMGWGLYLTPYDSQWSAYTVLRWFVMGCEYWYLTLIGQLLEVHAENYTGHTQVWFIAAAQCFRYGWVVALPVGYFFNSWELGRKGDQFMVTTVAASMMAITKGVSMTIGGIFAVVGGFWARNEFPIKRIFLVDSSDNLIYPFYMMAAVAFVMVAVSIWVFSEACMNRPRSEKSSSSGRRSKGKEENLKPFQAKPKH